MKWFKIWMAGVATSVALHAQTAVLVDVSGSMTGKEQVLSEVVQHLKSKISHIRVFAFNNDVKEISSYDSFTCGGGTNMYPALQRADEVKSKTIFLITDGLPSQEDRVRQVARKLRKNGTHICTVYLETGGGGYLLAKEISDTVFSVKDAKRTLLEPCIRYAVEHQWDVAVVYEKDDVILDSMNIDASEEDVPVSRETPSEEDDVKLDSMQI